MAMPKPRIIEHHDARIGLAVQGGEPENGEAGAQGEAGRARVVETHVSLLFFVGDRVYKLRKPVAFEFLDFRQREARREDCQREVALNSRLAPDAYLGVADIQMDGVFVDHMVVMRRMPDERRLARMASDGADLAREARSVAKTLADFHSKAARSSEISSAATREALQANWEANFAETEPFVGAILDGQVEAEIHRLVEQWLKGREQLLSDRIASGRVCDGHGDLQAEDIFCLDDGIRILDCIEFSDRLRFCDVIADVAFLAMDLERLGRPEVATRFLSDYQEFSGDRFPDSLVHHYSASRAYVRAKVACLRSRQGAPEAAGEAVRLQALALSHLRQARVNVVLVGGLPGSGKSTLAAGLGATNRWPVLRSDDIRWEMGRTADDESPPGYLMARYTPAHTAEVYEELLQRAARQLERGESVILDASWIDQHRRDEGRRVADRTSSNLIEFCCKVHADEAIARIERRLSQHADVSEATPEVRVAMEQSMDTWPSATLIDTSGVTPEQSLALALDALAK
jgi:hypothetical protein